MAATKYLAELAMQCSMIENHVAYSARNFAQPSFSDVIKIVNAGLATV